MRYHLKEDGTAGPCKAAEGNCPKGDAIHGDSIEQVYAQLEKVMKDQLFGSQAEPFEVQPPRKSPEELGTAGAMLTLKNPEIVREQMDGFVKLGLREQAAAILERSEPTMAAAYRNGKEDALDIEKLTPEVKRWRELYEEHDLGNGHIVSEYRNREESTWVAKAGYELQTLALNHLMDTLETGELEGTDLEALRAALGGVKATSEHQGRVFGHDFAHLAFNFNPERQPYEFYNNLKNRLVREGFDKKKIAENKHRYNVPAFLWKGLDQAARERFATNLLVNDLYARGYGKETFHGRTLGRDFGKIMSATFAPHKELHSKGRPEGEPTAFLLDWDGSKAHGSFQFTDDGFEWLESSRIYAEPEKKQPNW